MGLTAARRWLTLLGALAVLFAGFLVWSPGLNGPYQFDDYATPLDDPASHSLAAWRQHLPLTLRPLTKLSYALEADAGLTSRPGVRRAFSIGLLAAGALLLYLLIARLQPGLAPLGTVFLAALWFVHPVHADSVLMLSGRTAVLAAMDYQQWIERSQQQMMNAVQSIDERKVEELQKLIEEFASTQDAKLMERVEKLQTEIYAPMEQLGDTTEMTVAEVATPPGAAEPDQVHYLIAEEKDGHVARVILVYRQKVPERTVMQMAWDLRGYPRAWAVE
jgi:gas vesicle protein